MSRGRAEGDRWRDGCSCCVAAQHLYTTISPARDKSPVAVRPPLSYRRSYFNILKFYPKCAVYQNFYHKLLARLSSPAAPILFSLRLPPLVSHTHLPFRSAHVENKRPVSPVRVHPAGFLRETATEPSFFPLPPSLLISRLITENGDSISVSRESFGFHPARLRYSTTFLFTDYRHGRNWVNSR